MRTRTQQWWLTGGLVLAPLSGGAALRSGFGIGGKTIAGFGISGNPVAGVIWSGNPAAVVHPHTPTRDGYALGG